MADNAGVIVKVSGPLVVAEGLDRPKMFDLVKVGEEGLMGEIIELRADGASIQVYEETAGLGPGDPVVSTGEPLSVELGPGLLTSIYDGVQRPLQELEAKGGAFMGRGITASALDREKKWDFKPAVKSGAQVVEGDVIGTVQETEIIEHRVMVPPGVGGTVKSIEKGKFTVEDTVAVVETAGAGSGSGATGGTGEVALTMMQRWPVRLARPMKERHAPEAPLVTGQRVIDSLFPIAKGGTACVPGPFGSGKTVIQHQISKWADSEIVIFIGCGERGNEMTDVLIEFPELIDPHSGHVLMKRTVLIANTSNMPVAAREASVYTGITIAEYFRDMGYNVALQADSTSRWAEALREISGRLEEMPGEEGFPAYLGTRLASFYERSGRVTCLGSDNREGTLTVIGSVSPPGGDLSEPVVQNTLRVAKVFWALEDRLAYERHFPAINWLVSYSLYLDKMEKYWVAEVGEDMKELHDKAMEVLSREAELTEIVRLVGIEALSLHERVVMETAKSIREDFLQQSAFHELDTYTPLKNQYLMLKVILTFHQSALDAVDRGVAFRDIMEVPVRERITRSKFVPDEESDELVKLAADAEKEVGGLTAAEGGAGTLGGPAGPGSTEAAAEAAAGSGL